MQAERVEHAQARRAQLKGLEDLDVEHDERPIRPDAPRPEERAHEAVGAHLCATKELYETHNSTGLGTGLARTGTNTLRGERRDRMKRQERERREREDREVA